jgi:quercetin dioxygenase-like cupin family protein
MTPTSDRGPRRHWRRLALLALVAATGAAAVRQSTATAVPSAAPAEEADARRAAEAIERTLQRHGGEVHRCFEKALADTMDVQGKVEIEAEVGQAGKVARTRVLSQGQEVAPGLSDCVLASAANWQVEGIEAGATVVLPFAFQGQNAQFVIKAADTLDRGPGANKPKGSPGRAPPFTVKVLADPVNVRAEHMSLTLLSVGPASRVAMHRHPRSAKVLYLLKGRARILGPAGQAALKLDEGTAVFVPAAYPHVIENMGRQATAVFLQAFAPPGPEKVYREPQNAEARTDFEVIRDPRKATKPPPANGKLVARKADEADPLSILGGKGTARIVLDEAITGSNAMAVDLVEFAPGAEIPRHEHAGNTEILYVVSGGGNLVVGSEKHAFGAEHVLHLPPSQPHGAKIAGGEKTIAIQFYAPAGPEQRFREGSAKK